MDGRYEANGAIVPGLADRNGIRYSKSGSGKHGGRREKNGAINSMGWIEEGAREAMEEKRLNIV